MNAVVQQGFTFNAATELPLDKIELDPEQPRKDVPEDYIISLADSIRAHNVRQPITVRGKPDGEGWIVVYGECRYRASILAGKSTIPALLADDDVIDDKLTRLLAQVSENYVRRDLNPVELAEMLRRLRDDFGLKSNKAIGDALKQHGISAMSRPYISNTMRLLDLPEWALNLLRANEITATHGKHLLVAQASQNVAEQTQALFAGNQRPSTRDLQNEIFRAFVRHHVVLDNESVRFNYKETCVKSGCQKIRKVSNSHEQSHAFCLDTECYIQKNQQARQQTQQKNTEDIEPQAETTSEQQQTADTTAPQNWYAAPVVAPDNTVDVDEQNDLVFVEIPDRHFDDTQCKQCENYHIAVFKDSITGEETKAPACFAEDETCFDQKDEAGMAQKRINEAADESIKHWLADNALLGPVDTSRTAQDAILLAVGSNLDDCAWPAVREAENMQQDADLSVPGNFSDCMNAADTLRANVAISLLGGLELHHLMVLAKFFNLSIQDWEPNELWLRLQNKGDLITQLIDSAEYDESDLPRLEKMNITDLVARIIDYPGKHKVPDIIANRYAELLEKTTAESKED